MLGYELTDTDHMREAIYRAKIYLPPNEDNDYVRAGLEKAEDLINGLLAEGHFD
jgi:hypothetical protein